MRFTVKCKFGCIYSSFHLQLDNIYEELFLFATRNRSCLKFLPIFKKIKSKRKTFRESFAKTGFYWLKLYSNLNDFLSLSIISIHHNLNIPAISKVWNIPAISKVNQKNIRKFQENLRNTCYWWRVPATHKFDISQKNFSFKFKYGTKSRSICSRAVFMMMFLIFLLKLIIFGDLILFQRIVN